MLRGDGGSVYDAADFTVLVADTVDSLRLGVSQTAAALGFNGARFRFRCSQRRSISFCDSVVSKASADEVLAALESDDALDIDIVVADVSVRVGEQHVFERIQANFKARKLPVPPLVLVARDAAPFQALRHVAVCCLVRPVVKETLAACLDWVVRRRILKQSMSDLLRQRIFPVWDAIVVSERADDDDDDAPDAAATAAAATAAAAAAAASAAAASAAPGSARKSPRKSALRKSDRPEVANDNDDDEHDDETSATNSTSSSSRQRPPETVAAIEPATRRKSSMRRHTIDDTAASQMNKVTMMASAKEITFSDQSSSTSTSTSSDEDGDQLTALMSGTDGDRRGSLGIMLRRRMPSFSARARSRQGTDNAMVLARVAVAMTKALEADKLDDELRADFKNLVNTITKRSESTPVKALQAESAEVSASALDTVASRSSDPATKEWLLSEYGSVEESFARRTSTAASFPSRKVLDVIATDKLKSWSFDPFVESELALLYSIPTMFEAFELFTRFKIDRKVFENFLVDVRATYNANAYHNFRHAFDVTQTVFAMLTTFDAAALVTHVEILGLLLAAICHDLDHPGLNNAYQVRVGSDLALRYNDRSVLENYHGYVASVLLKKPKNDFLASLDDEQRRAVRAVMTTAILGTDVSDHFEFLSRFRDVMSSRPNGLDRGTADDRLLAVQMLLKAADISNVCKPWRVARKWGDVLMDEFFAQGDREKSENLVPAVFMDRTKTTSAKVSINFIDYVAGVLFTEFAIMLPAAGVVLQLMASNRRHLLRVEKKQAKALGVPAMIDIERERQRAKAAPRKRSSHDGPLGSSGHRHSSSAHASAAAAATATATAAGAHLGASEKGHSRRKKRNPMRGSSSKARKTTFASPAVVASDGPLNNGGNNGGDKSATGSAVRKTSSASESPSLSLSPPKELDVPAAGEAATASASGSAADAVKPKVKRVRRKSKKVHETPFSLSTAVASSREPKKQQRAITGGLNLFREQASGGHSKSKEV